MAVTAALRLLNEGGLLYTAFISSFAAVWDYLANVPGNILDAGQEKYFTRMSKDEDFKGLSFTQTHFIRPKGVDIFMKQFPLEKLHFIGCESILALRENELKNESPEVLHKWIDFAAELCEREVFYLCHTTFCISGGKYDADTHWHKHNKNEAAYFKAACIK